MNFGVHTLKIFPPHRYLLTSRSMMEREVSKLAAEAGAALVELLEQRMPPAFRRAYEAENGEELAGTRARVAELEARVAELERRQTADAEAVRALDARARRCEECVARIGEEFNRVQQEHRLWMGSDKDAIGNLLRSITSAERVAAILLHGGAAGDECLEAAAGMQGAAVADDQLWAEQHASMAIDCEKALPCQPPAARCPLPLPDLPAACRRQDSAAADGRAAHSPPRTGALLGAGGGAGGTGGHGGRHDEPGPSELVGAEPGSDEPCDAASEGRHDGNRKRGRERQIASRAEAVDRARSGRKASRGEGGRKLSLSSKRKSDRSQADLLSSSPPRSICSQQSSISSGRSFTRASPTKQPAGHERGKRYVSFSAEEEGDSKRCGGQQTQRGQSGDHALAAAFPGVEPAGSNSKDTRCALDGSVEEVLDSSGVTTDGEGAKHEMAKHNEDEIIEVRAGLALRTSRPCILYLSRIHPACLCCILGVTVGVPLTKP
jgi:hypothetical protein